MATLTTFLKLLKPEKNDYVDVEKHISENYDKIDTEFLKIDTKFKNYCPISVGSIDVRYDNKNPAELYPGTTWELVASDKYIRTGSTPLSTGGNNSINILKENLPNTKLQVESFNLTRGTMDITGGFNAQQNKSNDWEVMTHGAFTKGTYNGPINYSEGSMSTGYAFQASRAWTGATSNASPYTNPLGSGTPLTIEPSYITLKFWKRLS